MGALLRVLEAAMSARATRRQSVAMALLVLCAAQPAWPVAYRAEVVNPDFQQAAHNPDTGTLVLVGSDTVFWRRPAADAAWQPARTVAGGTGGTLHRVAFAGGVGLAVGEDGLLMRSEDDGVSWVRVPAPAGAPLRGPLGGSLRDVLPLPGDTWLAAGSGGQVLRSADAGRTWVAHAIGAPVQLNRLFAAGDGSVWAVGEAGLIAVSGDGGQAWQVRHHDGNAPPLRSISGHRGLLLAGGGQGWLLRSGDGGRTWQTRPTPSAAFIEVLQRVPRHGTWVALTHQGERLWSADGGRHWHAAGAPLGTALSALWHDAARGRLVAVGHAGVVQRSADGGRRWTRQHLAQQRDLLGVAAHAGGLAAWGRQGLLLQADAQGRRWQVLREALSPETTTLAALPDGQTVLAAGMAGWMARSSDGGASWRPVPMKFMVDMYPTDFRALRVLPPGPGRGHALLAAGPTASVMRSDDGGQAWHSVLHRPFETAEVPVDLVATREGGWLAPEMSGPIDHSLDDGRTWQRRAAPAPWPDGAITRTGLASAFDGTVLLAGRGPQLLRSADHGRQWQAVALPGPFNLFALWADPHGPRWWLAGADGALLRSDDAGRTWRVQRIEVPPGTAPVASVLLNLSRTPGGRMLVAGRDGVLAASDDGERWTRVPTGTTQDLRVALQEPGTGRLVLVGRGGTVLRCADAQCTRVAAIDSGTRSDFRAALFLPDGTLLAAGARLVRLVPRPAAD